MHAISWVRFVRLILGNAREAAGGRPRAKMVIGFARQIPTNSSDLNVMIPEMTGRLI
jgi:hypothetical protein